MTQAIGRCAMHAEMRGIHAHGVRVMRIAAGDATASIEATVDGIVRMAAELTDAECAKAPSTAQRAVPLPRSAGEDERPSQEPQK